MLFCDGAVSEVLNHYLVLPCSDFGYGGYFYGEMAILICCSQLLRSNLLLQWFNFGRDHGGYFSVTSCHLNIFGRRVLIV